MVTELVANAVVHGRGRITLTVCIDGGRIQGEVLDEGSGFEPEKRQRGVHHRRGGGLAIVDALSNGWGVLEGTTHVWFELRSPGESTTASALA